jgi:serine/threonine-protein kinase
MISYNKNVSDELESIILKACSKASAERFDNMDTFCTQLKRALTRDNIRKDEEKNYSQSTIKITQEDVNAIKKEAKLLFFEEDDYGEGKVIMKKGFNREVKSVSKLRKRIIIAAVLTSVAIVIVVFTMWASFFNKRNIILEIPDLVGMPIEEVDALSNSLGFVLRIDEYRSSNEYEKGEVITWINSEENIVKGGLVKVIVSEGQEMIIMPDLTKRDVTEVYEWLRDENIHLVLKEEPVNEDDVPIGIITKTQPSAGEEIASGSEVSIFYSIGQRVSLVSVPDFTNTTEAEAINSSRRLGLLIGDTTKMFSDTIEKGKVIRQTIEPYREVSKNTVISFVVSDGPAPTPSPTQTATPIPTASPTLKPAPSLTQKSFSVTSSEAGVTQDEDVNMTILKSSDDLQNVQVFSGELVFTDFPKSFNVLGSGVVKYMVYIDDQLIKTVNVNFDE